MNIALPIINWLPMLAEADAVVELADQVLALTLLMGIGIATLVAFRRLTIPYTVILVAIGIGLREGMQLWPSFKLFDSLALTPELTLFILLPILIFESGLNLDARQLVRFLPPTLTMAIPALFLSAAMVGVGLWIILGMDLKMALLFGALISATDPVAVIAIFRELGAPSRLTALVEGESLLNDATAIVLFHLLLGWTWAAGFGWSVAASAGVEFLTVFLGGAIVGIAMGWVGSRLLFKLRSESAAIVGLSCVLAYLSFIFAEHALHFSGVMAAAGAAVTLSVLGSPALGESARSSLESCWEFLALVCNTLLFLFVGLTVPVESLLIHAWPILVAVLLVHVARAALVYTLPQWSSKLFGLPDISLGERHIMFWGGLKGGLAIAMALSIPETMEGREEILNLTLGVVVFTLLVNATTIRPLIEWLGLTQLTSSERLELSHASFKAREEADRYLNRFRRLGSLSRSGRHLARQEMDRALGGKITDVKAKESPPLTHLLHLESRALRSFYHAGVIPQFLYLDLQKEIRRESESVRQSQTLKTQTAPPLFGWVERLALKSLREKSWAIPILARYQNMRVSKRLSKLMTRLILVQTAMEEWDVKSQQMSSFAQSQFDAYKQAQDRRLNELEEVRADFPEFFASFETRTALKTALSRALVVVEEEWNHGEIGSKPFALLERQISVALDLARLEEKRPISLGIDHFIGLFPLFEDLSGDVKKQISKMVHPMDFLVGDIVIGQGDTGDALYIVAKGKVEVSRKESKSRGSREDILAILGPGEFFGETALFGDSVRTATVKAKTACLLLRLTQSEILNLAQEHPEIERRLEEAQLSRSKMNEAFQQANSNQVV
jgi:monovalent cation:H+ antiporter, CPA1 family